MAGIEDRGGGKISLPAGAVVIALPTCPGCKKLVTVCECGLPNLRPAA